MNIKYETGLVIHNKIRAGAKGLEYNDVRFAAMLQFYKR